MIDAMPRPRLLLALTSGLVLAGCSASGPGIRTAPPAPLREPASITEWESLVRPDGLHMLATAIALLGADDGKGSCPRVERSGSVTTLTGDCSDASGKRHEGRARVVTHGNVTRVRLDDYDDAEVRATGRVRLVSEPQPRFAMDLRLEPGLQLDDSAPAPAWTALDVEGYRDTEGWHALGTLAAEGRGSVRMRARGIELGKACPHEPLRGTVGLWSGEHQVRIDYDGATDCDPEGTARWSLDGVAQGELEGIAGNMGCEASEDGGEVPVSGAMLLLLGIRRRRRRPADRRAPEPTDRAC